MASNENQSITTVPSFAPPPIPTSVVPAKPAAGAARFGETLMGKLGALFAKAIDDASSLEVKTFTSSSADTALATEGDPLGRNTRLRAFTRIALDGDTQICVPVGESGAPDEALWKIHNEAVAQARADRKETIATVVAAVQSLSKAIR